MKRPVSPRLAVVTAASVAFALVLAACSPPGASTKAKPDDTAPFEVTLLAAGDPPDFDPHTAGGTEKANVIRNVYDTLTVLSADLKETLPSLATGWKAVDDTTWEFTLRDDVDFSNGEHFDAEAVKFSVDRILDPNAEVARVGYSFPTMESAEVVDEKTVRIHTSVPDPILPERAYSLQIVAPKYAASVPEKELAMNPVGTGAYKLAEFVPGQQIVLEANEGYWGGAPEVDRFIIRPVPEASTRTAELQTGGADIIQGAPVGQIPEIEATDGVHVVALAGRRVSYIGMNLLAGSEALKDKRVRQALNYAVDVDLILDSIMEGHGNRVATVFRPDFTGFDAGLKPYQHDPAKAKKLLADAGHADGLELTFQTSEVVFASATEVVNALTAQLAEVGVKAKVEILDHPSYRSVVIDGQDEAAKVADLYAWQWGALEPSPDSVLNGTLETGGISSYYSNPELDALIQAARQEMDEGKRIKIYKQVQALLKEEAPFIFLYQIPDVYGISDRVDFAPRLDQYIVAQELKRGSKK